MLTRKQYQLLMFIHDCMQKQGVPPSFDEMKEALELKSKSGIHRLITGLEERGFLRRLPHRARALEILRLPDNMEQGEVRSRPAFSPRLVEVTNETETPSPPVTPLAYTNAMHLPLYGRIAAGTPIEALRDKRTCSMCRLTWSAAAITMRWRSKAIRWSMPAYTTATM